MEPIIISASFFQEQPSLGVLGRTGEHEARRISFDCGEVLKTWPEAAILCVCRRPCDTAAYPIPLTADGTTYTMPLTSRETAAAGTIKLELRAVQDDTVLKSAIFYGRILPSLNGQKDAPGNPLSDALNRLESTIADAQTLADEIRQKLDNGEFVGERGPQGEPGKDGSDANVTAENIQSALGYAPVRDVQIAGSSVLVDGVANVPVASGSVFGVIKTQSWGGTMMDDNGYLVVYPSTIDHVTGRVSKTVITPTNLDYAVKAAMCDGKGAAWTDAEQKAARERMGIPGNFELLHSITVGEGGATRVDIPSFPALHHIMALVVLPPTAPMGFYLASNFDSDGLYVAGTTYGNIDHTQSIRFEVGIEGGIAFSRSSGYIKGWGGGSTIGPNNAGQAISAQSITSAYLYTPTEGKIIPEATKIEIYGVKI